MRRASQYRRDRETDGEEDDREHKPPQPKVLRLGRTAPQRPGSRHAASVGCCALVASSKWRSRFLRWLYLPAQGLPLAGARVYQRSRLWSKS
jgi:hypothetical protein